MSWAKGAELKITIVILTYQRPSLLDDSLSTLARVSHRLNEIIVVDNSTNDETRDLVAESHPGITYLRNSNNTGVAGRNLGMSVAQGDIVITLDDDVIGITEEDLDLLETRFMSDAKLGAVCFRVLHYETGDICNWCHHRISAKCYLDQFPTYEISEGAVAFRRTALELAGYYCEDFFISHEGKDLAYRIMNTGFSVEYDGRISVIHHHAFSGRDNWRRYYYDTRNAIWLAIRNMPFLYGLRFLATTLAAMAVYSIRDNQVKSYFRALVDGVRGIGRMRATRQAWTSSTVDVCREIDRMRPGFLYMIRKRLFRRGVQI